MKESDTPSSVVRKRTKRPADLITFLNLKVALSIRQRTFDALPVADDVATSYGHLAAAVAGIGRQPRSRVFDLLIAATAHAHGALLNTRNAADLIGIDDLVEIVSI